MRELLLRRLHSSPSATQLYVYTTLGGTPATTEHATEPEVVSLTNCRIILRRKRRSPSSSSAFRTEALDA